MLLLGVRCVCGVCVCAQCVGVRCAMCGCALCGSWCWCWHVTMTQYMYMYMYVATKYRSDLELFNRLRSRSLTELTRQISENGPAPPPVESKKSLVSPSFPMLCCVVRCMWCVCRRHFLLIFPEKTQSGTLSFHVAGFSKPLTFHNGFMFFASRRCFKHFSKLQAYLFHI